MLGVLLFALALTGHLVGRSTVAAVLHYHPSQRIKPLHVEYKISGSSTCECLNVCAWNTSCTGVTLRYRKNAATDICLFAATPLAKNNLTSVTNESRTFLKSLQCDASFSVVPGVGCIWLSPDQVSGIDAKTSCPYGSALAVTATQGILENLSKYIGGLLVPKIGEVVFVGMKVINSEYVWNGGHVHSGDVLELNHTGMPCPGPGAKCIAISYNSLEDNGQLASQKCCLLGRYVCMIK